MMSSEFSLERIALFLSVIAVYLTVQTATVRYTSSDPQLALLTSQSILRSGDVNLDEYQLALPKNQFAQGAWKNYGANGHTYYFYPLGTPLLSVPFVALANLLGYDMSIAEHDRFWQIQIAAIAAGLLMILLYTLSRQFFTHTLSWFFSTAIVFSSSLLSVSGTALWSSNFEVIFVCLALLEIVKLEKDGNLKFRPVYMGLLLFMAWFVRPSALSFIVPVFGWIAWRQSLMCFVKSSLVTLAALGLFVLFSSVTYDRWLPLYYDPFTWTKAESAHSVFFKLKALLFSPLRGLFIYMPLFLIGFSGLLMPKVRKSALYILMLSWFLLHLIMLTRHSNWWGGWCYGPRLFTDAIPALIVMLFMSLDAAKNLSSTIIRKFLMSFVLSSILVGCYVHTVQGLYNPASIEFNNNPPVDDAPDFYAWNWRYPAFLVTPEMIGMKQLENDMWSRCKKLSSGLKEGETLFCFEPDARGRKILEKLNRSNRQFNKVKFFNNLFDLHLSECDTFWTTAAVRELLNENPDVEEIKEDVDDFSLGQYLRKHENHTVVLTFSPDSIDFTSEETHQYLSSKGMSMDSVGFAISALACFRNGVLQELQMDENEGAYLKVRVGDEVVWISSGSQLFHKASSILYKGVEHALLKKGWNVLVLDENGEIVQNTAFETNIADRQFRDLRRMRFIEP
jgi:hypothetical protein